MEKKASAVHTKNKFNSAAVNDGAEIGSGLTELNDAAKRVPDGKRIKEQAALLEQQNAQLKMQANLLDLSNEAIFAWDLHGAIIYWNKGAERKYGYSSDEAVGRVSHELLKTVHPSGLSDFELKLARDGTWRGEIEHTTKEGKKLIIETRQQIISDEYGKHIVLETNRDISKRIIMEKEIKDSLDKNTEILESINDGFFSLNREWKYTYINQRAAKNMGFEPYELLNKRFWDVFVYKGTTIETNFRKAMEERVPVSFENHSTLSDKYYTCNIYPAKDGISVYWIDITEKKKAEENLANANRLNREILESINDGFFSLNSEWLFTYINHRAAMNVGFEPEELLNENIWDTFTGYKGSEMESVFRKVMADGESVSFELFGKAGNKCYDCSVYPARDGISVYWLDITERKMMEEELKTGKNLLETVIEDIPDGIAVYDNKGNLIKMNAKGRELYPKINADSSVGIVHKGFQFFDLDNNSIPIENLPSRRVMKGEKIKNKTIIIKDENSTKYIEINAIPIFNDKNDLTLAIVIHHDITDLVMSQREVEKQRNTAEANRLILETVIQQMPAGIILTNEMGSQAKTNDAMDKIWRRSMATHENINEHGYVAYHPDGTSYKPEEWPLTRALINNELVIGEEMTFLRGDGTLGTLLCSAAAAKDESGKTIAGVVIDSDITELRQAQNNVLYLNELAYKAEKEKNDVLQNAMDMKDEFISLISHEFKTPITVINAALETIELICNDELSETNKQFLNIIRQNSNRQLKLVNNLLDVTRALTGHLKICKKNMDIVELTDLITKSISVYAEKKGIELSFSSTIKRKVIGIDDEKFERVLLNLLSNAVKFTPSGKSIAVQVSQKVVERKCKICIRVKDEGVGIPENKQKLIFERFGQADSSRTRNAEGTGIGLYLVKMLVEFMDGEIALESKEGSGSTFTVILPIEKAKASPIEQMVNVITDNRSIGATAIEFSDLYYKKIEK